MFCKILDKLLWFRTPRKDNSEEECEFVQHSQAEVWHLKRSGRGEYHWVGRSVKLFVAVVEGSGWVYSALGNCWGYSH